MFPDGAKGLADRIKTAVAAQQHCTLACRRLDHPAGRLQGATTGGTGTKGAGPAGANATQLPPCLWVRPVSSRAC